MWAENENKPIKGYYITDYSEIVDVNDFDCKNVEINYNVFATKTLAKRALAMARISQKMANDERFGGVITDEEWCRYIPKYTIGRGFGKIHKVDDIFASYRFLAFHTREQRDLFLKENEQLIKDYFMIK